jgi:hypothetical protein
MKLDEIRDAFLVLHGEVTHLLSDAVPPTRSRWRLVVQRWHLRQMQDRFAALSQRFEVLDAHLIRHAELPKDFDAFRTTATFDFYGAVREEVRAKLSDTEAALGSLRNHMGFQSPRAVIVIGLALAIGLVVAIVALFV